MPELAQIVQSLLNGTIEAIEKSEVAHLKAQIDAVKALKGKGASLDDLQSLFDNGYLPDYFAGDELTLTAQLSMTTGRERQSGVSAGGSIAGITVQGSLTETFRQATQTNLSVTINLSRQSRNRAIDHTLTSLQSLPTPAPAAGGGG